MVNKNFKLAMGRYICLLVLVIPVSLLGKQSRLDKEILEIFAEDWEYNLARSPIFASFQGDKRYNQSWPDLSQEAFDKHESYLRDLIKKLKKIDQSQLSDAQKTNMQLFTLQKSQELQAIELGMQMIALTSRDGIQFAFNNASFIPMSKEKHYRDWIARLKKIPLFISQTQDLLQQGIDKKVTQAKVSMEKVTRQLELITKNKGASNPFYKAFDSISEDIEPSVKKDLQSEAIKTINEIVIPAYLSFSKFFKEKYLPNCRLKAGIGSVPGGQKIYQHVVNEHTTLTLSSDAIHKIGLGEVARIKEEMRKVMKSTDYKGSLEEFFTWLRTDPKFFFKTPEELFDAYMIITKKIDPELVKLFGKLPRIPYGLRAIPDEQAPDTTTAYYSLPASDGSRAGYYYVNLYKPETRPKWEMEVLSAHEAVPGHHLQISLAYELENVPNFRRFRRITAYVEGWALYSEVLGFELGLYKDPYSHFGQLSYDMWRAVRLVVDTGIHAKGWSRDRAIEYFMSNTPKTKQDIVNEVDRYIDWPGQALAYKMGQLKILELRKRAETKLGSKFDIRKFHDQILGSGYLTLDLLEEKFSIWLDKQEA